MAGEGNLENFLIHLAAAHRVYIRKVKAVGRVGFPDRMLAYGSKAIFVELKNPNGKGKLSKMQEREIEKMRAVGLDVRVIWTREGVEDVVREISKT